MSVVDLITMGCSKNLVDSERLLYRLRAAGFRVYHNPQRIHRDVAIVNTCGFINDAKEESIDMILQLAA
ncbi:MAG: 30S ribosomal protein S12 methylthiotransferase RimO, partial [Bacteroidaceae bacterium]|nr:30S ribosomal protein S12 methylthiotransferase RimO [Bacteroidaceae bacterium]